MSKVDWSKAPKGTEFWCCGLFYKTLNGKCLFFAGASVGWVDSTNAKGELIESYVNFYENPNHIVDATKKVWPTESRIEQIGQNGGDELHYDEQREQHEAQHDPVNNPKHYAIAPNIEAIDIIRASLTPEQFKGYLLGNFLKYRLRAGDKGDLQQDIDKSNWYRERLNALRELSQ